MSYPALKLYIVIPTHNRWEEASTTLAKLLESNYENFEVILIEDGCSDETVVNCRRQFPRVTILHGNGKLWWSGAINLGTAYALRAGADAVVWINDDNRVEPETLDQLIACYRRQKDPRSVVAARVKAAEAGASTWSGQPPLWHSDSQQWSETNFSNSGGDVLLKHPPYGQGVLIPSICFREIGLVDLKKFPHYWADCDFHYRAMAAGYRYILADGAVVWNLTNRKRIGEKDVSTPGGILWTLFHKRSTMNIIVLRRLLKKHLQPRQYRQSFYRLYSQQLTWLIAGWSVKHSAIHYSLRFINRLFRAKTVPWP